MIKNYTLQEIETMVQKIPKELHLKSFLDYTDIIFEISREREKMLSNISKEWKNITVKHSLK